MVEPGLGDKLQQVFKLLLPLAGKAYDERATELTWTPTACQFDPVRDEPRFQELLRRMNLPTVKP